MGRGKKKEPMMAHQIKRGVSGRSSRGDSPKRKPVLPRGSREAPPPPEGVVYRDFDYSKQNQQNRRRHPSSASRDRSSNKRPALDKKLNSNEPSMAVWETPSSNPTPLFTGPMMWSFPFNSLTSVVDIYQPKLTAEPEPALYNIQPSPTFAFTAPTLYKESHLSLSPSGSMAWELGAGMEPDLPDNVGTPYELSPKARPPNPPLSMVWELPPSIKTGKKSPPVPTTDRPQSVDPQEPSFLPPSPTEQSDVSNAMLWELPSKPTSNVDYKSARKLTRVTPPSHDDSLEATEFTRSVQKVSNEFSKFEPELQDISFEKNSVALKRDATLDDDFSSAYPGTYFDWGHNLKSYAENRFENFAHEDSQEEIVRPQPLKSILKKAPPPPTLLSHMYGHGHSPTLPKTISRFSPETHQLQYCVKSSEKYRPERPISPESGNYRKDEMVTRVSRYRSMSRSPLMNGGRDFNFPGSSASGDNRRSSDSKRRSPQYVRCDSTTKTEYNDIY